MSHTLAQRMSLVLTFGLLAVSSTSGQTTYTWTGGGVDGNWSRPENWGSGPPSNFTETVLRLSGSTNPATIVDSGLPTSASGGVTPAYEIRTLQFAAGSGPFTIAAGSGGPTVRINTGIVVEAGNTTDHTISANLATGSTGSHTWVNNGSGVLTVSGPVFLGGSGFSIGGPGNVSVSGAMTSAGAFNGITYNGTGLLTVTGENTYGGFTNIVQSTMRLGGGNNRLPTTTTVRLGAGSTALPGTLDLFGTSQQVAGLTTLNNLPENRVVSTAVNSAGTLRIANVTSQTFLGTLGGSGGNTFGLTKVETGVFTLTQANTYTGPTFIQTGTIRLAGTGSIANSAVITVGEATNSQAFLDVSTGTGGLTGGANFDSVTGQFALAPGQTLQGAGRGLTGGVTVRPGSAVQGFANGSSLNTLTVSGNVTVVAAGTVAPAGVLRTWVRNTGTAVTNTSLTISGGGNDLNFANVTTNGSKFALEIRNAGGLQPNQPYTITLATVADQIQRNGVAVGGNYTFDAGDYNLTSADFTGFTGVSLFTSGSELRLSFTPVPEPGSVFAIGVGAVGLLGLFRRQRRERQSV